MTKLTESLRIHRLPATTPTFLRQLKLALAGKDYWHKVDKARYNYQEWPHVVAALLLNLPDSFPEVTFEVIASGEHRILTAHSGRTTIAMCQWKAGELTSAEEIFSILYPT